jgi:hypothetical protein
LSREVNIDWVSGPIDAGSVSYHMQFPDTKRLVETHIYPLLTAFGVRTVQVTRHGPSKADGITVLADTTSPTICHIEGAYRLSQELFLAGTVPEVAHRKCAIKSKGACPDGEEFLVACPHLVGVKQKTVFESNWSQLRKLRPLQLAS